MRINDIVLKKVYCKKPPGGGHLYFKLDIILVKGLSKHTLNTYFSGMNINPKYPCLHAFFSISVILFKKIANMTKNTPFSTNFVRFCILKRCARVHCLVLKNNPNNVIFFFFYEDDIQLQIQVPPPRYVIL